jgi:hypothetical protein
MTKKLYLSAVFYTVCCVIRICEVILGKGSAALTRLIKLQKRHNNERKAFS